MDFKRWIIVVGTIALLPSAVHAAGLGKLTVMSALGEPLRAEIELVSVASSEIDSLQARIASSDAYQQADIEYSAVLLNVKISVEKKKSGDHYLRLTSTRPINEPFLDLLLEVSWASVRLLREYKTLIGPPTFAPTEPVAPVVAAETKSLPPVVVPQSTAEKPANVESTSVASKPSGEYGPVKRGDTLFKIARSAKSDDASLEQMLVAIFNSNRDAFDGNNMNRLKTGKILKLPEASEAGSAPQEQAVKEIRAQAADWHAYRNKLAQAATETTTEESTKQTTSGKISTAVEDKGAGAETAKDVLKLSKGDTSKISAKGAAGLQEKIKNLEEEAIARDKSVKEANERVAQLEKNIQDIQHLLEVSNQQLAAMQNKSAKPAPEPAAKAPPAETKPEVAPAVETTPPTEPQPAAVAPKVKEPAKPVTAKKPAAPAEPELGLVDQILAEPIYLAAGGGIIVLLLGIMALRRRKSRGTVVAKADKAKKTRDEEFEGSDLDKTVIMPQSDMSAAASSGMTQSAEEFDPIPEAEVFIAYGRDPQAEEILKDAIGKDASRNDVREKLLEVYFARKDMTAYESVAKELFSRTRGEGDQWARVASMGYGIDPRNPLYAAGKGSDLKTEVPALPAGEGHDLDFDIGTKTGIMSDEEMKAAATSEMDFDLDAASASGAATDISFDAPTVGTETDISLDNAVGTETDFALDTAGQTGNVIDFDFDASTIAAPAVENSVGLPDINLSFGSDNSPEDGSVVHDDHWYDVQTKFDLARAYHEMGDKEGAREILKEVVQEGDAKQQEDANALLASLA